MRMMQRLPPVERKQRTHGDDHIAIIDRGELPPLG